MRVNEKELADFGMYLGAESSLALPMIEKLAIEEGLSPGGFSGVLLQPLADVCTGPAAEAVEQTFLAMRKALCNLGDGVLAAAKHYGHMDENNKSVFERTENWYRGEYKRYLPESRKEK